MSPPALRLVVSEPAPEDEGVAPAPAAAPARGRGRPALTAGWRAATILGSGAWWYLVAVACTVIACVVAVVPLGWRPLTVLSGSMTPTLRTGDVIISAPLRPDQARVGDVVTFNDPSRANALVTHRIVKLRLSAGKAYVVTRGDANTGVEKWSVAADGRIGRVVMHIPKVGYLTKVTGSPWARLLLALPLLLGGVKLIVRVWRDEPAAAEGGEPPRPAADAERAA